MHTSMSVGRYQADILSAGTFALDGGAMFGIIPKPVWEKRLHALAIGTDDHNRMDLGTNCLLLRDGARVVLVDCGMGEKWSGKPADQFKVKTHLSTSLQQLGLSHASITDLVLTHLHFDHAGGTTSLTPSGELQMAFVNARVHVGRRNWEWAQSPNERDRGSYKDDSWSPLMATENSRLVLHDDDNGIVKDIVPGVDAIVCDGHTSGQLLPIAGDKDQRMLYGADMVPTRAHVRMPWIMGYDLRPTVLLDEKRRLLSLCADEGVRLIYEHDCVQPTSMIARDGNDFMPVLS
jgi:glyoxylase-like metal-dependent hydrolase (beta-lactamase superfamily II)